MLENKTSLVCRMMSSAACAYKIDTKTTQFTPSQPYYEAVEYKTLPVPISGGSDNINAVLVGTTSDGIVIACRGTLPPAADLPSMLDWIQDVFFSMPKSVNGLPGKVHSGFYMAVNFEGMMICLKKNDRSLKRLNMKKIYRNNATTCK